MTRSCGAPTVSGPLFSRSVLACEGYCTMIEAERKSECLAICRDLCKDADVFLASSCVTAGCMRHASFAFHSGVEYSVGNTYRPRSAHKGGSHMPTGGLTPVFTPDEASARLRHAVHAKAVNFHAMYSSVLGGIVTDPAFMVLPLDDHMVHRGHAVFDTAMIVNGKLYQLEAHLERLLRSAEMARLQLPHTPAQLRQIIVDTAAASRQRDASIRYCLFGGPGWFCLVFGECWVSSCYVFI